jgi:Protein of unknown function (DUF2971)
MGSSIKKLLTSRPQGNLFHYTNQEGLLGIVRSKCLWASKVHYMNDAKEFKHALDLAKQEIWALRGSASGDWLRFLDEATKRIELVADIHVFVASLSEAGDLLSQWRGYCGTGSGFSIGFSETVLHSVLSAQGFWLAPCLYQASDKAQIVTDLLGEAKQALDSPIVWFDGTLESFIAQLLQVSPLLKDASFSEEKKWRIVCGIIPVSDSRFKIRAGRSMLVPYCDVKLEGLDGRLSIDELIIGPTPHPGLSSSSVTALLTSEKASWRHVHQSSIPYRNW